MTEVGDWHIPRELEPIRRRLVRMDPLELSPGPASFLLLTMAYAQDAELDQVRRHFSSDDFRGALREAPAGMFDGQSWRYWHQVLGLGPAPPVPRRPFVPADFEPDERFSRCVERTLPDAAEKATHLRRERRRFE